MSAPVLPSSSEMSIHLGVESINTFCNFRAQPPLKSAIRNPKSAFEWARQDSNLGPRDYESPALTAELQAQTSPNKSCRTPNVKMG
jgi:hypothetical protein